MGLALLGLLLAAAPLGDARVTRAISLYEAGSFAPARDLLLDVVGEGRTTPEDRAEARAYLAACYLALGDRGSARLQLRELEREQPDARPSPAVFVPELVALANEVWSEGERRRASQPPPLVEPRPVVLPPRPSLPGRGWAFLPFGVGQFRLGNRVQGGVLLGVEAVCFLLSAALLGALEDMKDHSAADYRPLLGGTVRSDKLEVAKSLNVAYSVTFLTGLLVMLGEIIKANVTWPTGDPS